ncbi:MAG: hypothetical protein LLG37_05935 [Spirochaetia bacterium]|nr:hypothetical protein [Spirochaetia bacterium]
MRNYNYAAGGIGIGSVIAIILVWQVHHSILWCILGAFMSWFYVVFYVLRYYWHLI